MSISHKDDNKYNNYATNSNSKSHAKFITDIFKFLVRDYMNDVSFQLMNIFYKPLHNVDF